MGNCQAIDNLVIQHPCGKVEKLYWPVTANDIMKMNPGHYVALLLTTTTTTTTPATSTAATNRPHQHNNNNSVRITRIKLLRPTDTLILGQVYRLVTTQEVMKGLWVKKYAKMKKGQLESGDKEERIKEKKNNQVLKHERHQPRTTTTSANSAAAKSKAWQPSLQSISEATS
ncbi:Phosphatidylinositol 3-kinase [Actinidia chinensis var. chinensis]|uniref:Phosphatidylinositol 3-kinase n=1 Tax=Actinidia chinensis var. chinensis TaxID=1590841 RepID=A0A2R6PDX8_ACTCC|nr:Phosphatidylinositol 3-kinase [Actinidia chinensis var. chinensis]